MLPNLTPEQSRALRGMVRMAEAVTTFVHGGCSGGWSLPESMACPECGATSDGRCAYDEAGGIPVTYAGEQAPDPAQGVLL